MALKSNLTNLAPSRERLKRQIKLLSGGYVSRTAFPDGMITVYPWDTMIDEALLRRKSKKNAGDTILYDILPKLCDLNGCPLGDFLVGDAYTILMVSRAMRRNCVYELTVTSPSGDVSQISVRIPDDLERVGEKGPDYPGYDLITLPDSNDIVKVRPLALKDERAVVSRSAQERSEMSDVLARTLYSIVSVNDGTPDSVAELQQYWSALSPNDQAFFQNARNDAFPHLSEDIKLEDPETGESYTVSLDLDEGFFR